MSNDKMIKHNICRRVNDLLARLLHLVAIIFFASLISQSISASEKSINFNRDIRPILSDKCFHCHGPDVKDRKGDLRFDMPDGKEGALTKRDKYFIIKPGDVENSALWSRLTTDDEDDVMPPPKSHKKPLNSMEKAKIKKWIEEGGTYEDFWAFISLKKIAPDTIKQNSWNSNFIDNRVMAHLESVGMQPKPEADKRTLIRRLSFDLTGLPPTTEEINNFLQDNSKDAYEKVVDRLLASPHYGEHMTRYWADLVRLADTNGMHKDFPRDFSTYRDWLIRSFNDNLPFDEFITYQLAGDLYEKPTNDQLIASGFNRLHLIIDKGTALPEESQHKNVADLVEAFGTVFLGLTVQCTQCHDHKYDPMTQKEYYQLYGFFNNFSGDPETKGREKNGVQAPFLTLDPLPGSDKPRFAMHMSEKNPPRKTFRLDRGSYELPKEEVERNTPAFLPPMKKKEGMYSRMDLAEWLVDKKHPLTARVAVNRFWQQIFGVGIVKTSEDFGAQGEWPKHPGLLDDLALQFIESDWDVKKLLRTIVLSNTYKQSSDAKKEEFIADPDNRHLARGSRYRMDSEMIRDQILMVSGQLNRTMYGRSVFPPQPPGLWKMVSMVGDVYKPDTDDNIYRRSLYTFWRRGMPPPQMTIFNAPSREACIARRERTNTPLQALLLMNEEEFFIAARKCAMNTWQETNDLDKAMRVLYEKISSHEPSAERMALMKKAYNDFAAIYQSDEKLTQEATPELKDKDKKERVHMASFTMLAHSLLNLELVKVRR